MYIYTRLGVRIKRTSLDNGRPLMFFIPSPLSLPLEIEREWEVCIRTDVPRLLQACRGTETNMSALVIVTELLYCAVPGQKDTSGEKQGSKLCSILVLDTLDSFFFNIINSFKNILKSVIKLKFNSLVSKNLYANLPFPRIERWLTRYERYG